MWPWFNSNPLMSMQDNSKKQLSASEAGDDLIHGDEAEKLSKSEKPNNGSGRYFGDFNTFRHGLRTPNEGTNQRNLKLWANEADKICFDCI